MKKLKQVGNVMIAPIFGISKCAITVANMTSAYTKV